MNAFYRMGWNDRVRKHSEDYGRVYKTGDGALLANTHEAKRWPDEDRAEYVRGWEDASAKIAALFLPEDSAAPVEEGWRRSIRHLVGFYRGRPADETGNLWILLIELEDVLAGKTVPP